MKRPFALIGITYLSVQAALFYINTDSAAAVTAVAGITAAIILFFLLKRRTVRQTALAVCLTAAFASLAFGGYSHLFREPIAAKYSDTEIKITATVIEEPVLQNDMYKYILKTDIVNDKKESIKISLKTFKRIDADEFDKISCNLTVTESTNNQLIADSVFLESNQYAAFDYRVEKTESKPLYYYAIKIRESVADDFEQLLPNDCSSLCRAVLLGEKSALSQEVLNDFQRCGVSFLIVVSGMHLVIVCSFVYFCIKRTVKNRIARSAVMLLCAFMFMAVSGFSPSVIRAGIMLGVVYSGKMFMRKGDSLNSLGIAALILTVPNPLAVADTGMILSFTSTLGIILWAKGISDGIMKKLSKFNKLKKPLEFIVNLFAVSVSASICTMPFSILLFGRFSAFSILLSMLLSPIVSLLIMAALLTAIFYSSQIFAFLAYPFGFISGVLSRLVLFTVSTFSDIPFSSVNAEKPYFYIWLAVSFILITAGYFVKNKSGYAVKGTVISLCVLALGFGIYSVIDVNTTVVNVYATGGNTVMIRRGKNCSVVSCAGKTSKIFDTVSDILLDTSKLDFVIVPSDKRSSTLYADVIQRKFDESDVLIYDSKDEKEDFGCRKFFTKNQSFNININSNTVDEVVSTESGVYQYITAGDKTILLFDYKCRTEDILPKHTTADYIITDRASENLNLLSGNCVILTNNSKDYELKANFDKVVSMQDDNYCITLD